MYNPFPGMNPYLEQPELWHQVHNRLIVAIADDLTPQIVPKYRVSIEERVYTSVDDALLVGVADIAVSRRIPTGTGATLTTPKLAEPSKVRGSGSAVRVWAGNDATVGTNFKTIATAAFPADNLYDFENTFAFPSI